MRGEIFLCAILMPCLALGQLVKGKDPLLGGWSKVEDLTSPLIESLANQALKLSGEGKPLGKALRMSKVLGASQQVVFGVNYRFVLLVSRLDCTEEEAQYTPSACRVEMVSICFFQLYTLLSESKYELSFSLCLGFGPVDPVSVLESLKKYVGVDTGSELVQRLAPVALALYGGAYKLESVLTSQFKVTLDKCFEAKFEMVLKSDPCFDEPFRRGPSGYCEKLLCNLEVKFELWTNVQSLVSKTCTSYDSPPTPDVLPREFPDVVGGWYPMDVTSPEAKKIVEEAVKTYETQLNFHVINYVVHEMKAQVVAGMNYNIRLTVTGCSLSSSQLCDILMPCTFKVFSRPWTNTFNLVATCQQNV